MRTVGLIWLGLGCLWFIPSFIGSMQKQLAEHAIDRATAGTVGMEVMLFFFFFLFPGLVLYGLGKRRSKKVK